MESQLASGCRMAYDDVGQGKVVVLLHAFPLCREMWRGQMEALRKDHRVLAPDQRGFGGTDLFSEPPTVEQMADDVNALLDALHVREPVVVLGLSMGGYVALAFARRHAGRLRGLVLADTRAEPDNAEGKANRDRMIAFAEKHPASAVIESMMPKMVSEETQAKRPQVVEEIRRLASAQSSDGIRGALAALRDRPDARPFLKNIRVPTLVVVGSEDSLTPPSMSEALASAIANAHLVKIPGAGHLANLEAPEAFNREVQSFLRTLA